jgi:hypothetical protein
MGTLKFLSDWSHQQDGDIRPGAPLSIEYSNGRVRCDARRYGQDAWSVVAYMRFHPSGEEKQGRVAPGSLTVQVPSDATRIELWFHNTDHTGCVAWDSQYGQNYWFDVTPASG